MQSNWNGLFLAEPRFRLAVIFAVTGVLLQVGLWLIDTDWITSTANLIFILVLRVIFSTAENIMHPPPSPIFNSGNLAIIGFFLTLIALILIASYFLTRLFLQITSRSAEDGASTAKSVVEAYYAQREDRNSCDCDFNFSSSCSFVPF